MANSKTVEKGSIVYVLRGVQTGKVSIWAVKEDADARRDKFNADPFLDDGQADPDAPYTVEAWVVS